MSGRVPLAARRGAWPALTACLLAAQGGASTRAVASHSTAGTGAAAPRDGSVCVALTSRNRADLLKTVPADLYLKFHQWDVMGEYTDLTESLYEAKTGTMGVWKCSALYRTLHVRGYEKAFNEKGVSIYITRKKGFWGSTIKVCFAKSGTPIADPGQVYTDGKILEFGKGKGCKEHPRSCSQLGVLADGVYGQVYDEFRPVAADKLHLPVDLLKFLERKEALVVNDRMAASINTGEKSGFFAARVVAEFKEAFRQKGVLIFYAQVQYPYECCVLSACRTCREWHHWFEYADVSVVGPNYVPLVAGSPAEFPQEYLEMYRECRNGDTQKLAKHLALASGQTRWGKCGDVAGAVGREKTEFPTCKCKVHGHRVFCAGEAVAGRKFDIKSVMTLSGCSERRAYCSFSACYPPLQPEDRP